MREYIEEGLGYPEPEKLIDERFVEDSQQSTQFMGMLMREWMEYHNAKAERPMAPLQAGMGTPPNLPVGPGGPFQAQAPGLQQPLQGGHRVGPQ